MLLRFATFSSFPRGLNKVMKALVGWNSIFFHASYSFPYFAIQNIKTELEMVREDLSVTQKDKFMLQAKVSELKNSMKSLLQQNQQLKMDLKHGKMKKVF